MSKPCFYFVPGGPWISGAYWDSFISKFQHASYSQRYKLINHEDNHSQINTPNFYDNINLIKNYLLERSNTTVVAHSYGAWITLLSIDKEIIKRIDKIFLVSMPAKLERTKVMQSFISDNNLSAGLSDVDFARYFKSLLPVYFYGTSLGYEYIAKECYKTGNQNLLITQDLLNEALEKAKEFDHKIFYIYGENDNVTGRSWQDQVGTNVRTLKECGHFPMLEKQEEFSKLISNVWEKPNLDY